MLGCLAAAAAVVALVVPTMQTIAVAVCIAATVALIVVWYRSFQTLEDQSQSVASLEVKVDRLENESRRHSNALDDLADGLDLALFLTTQDQQILYANRRARDFFGFDDPTGQTLLAVTLSNELTDLAKNATESKEPLRAEITLSQPRERIVLASVWMESSNQARVFVSLVDVTSLRRLERVRRDFVANVSHELRTPMTTIRAMAETAEDETSVDDPNRTYLTKIIREVDRLTRITDDLLILSATESAAPSKAKFDLAAAVNAVVQQLRPKASGKHLSLNYTAPPECTYYGNEGQLTQVVINLVDNALNYTTQGEVNVTLGFDPDDNIVLKVQDTGIGIASEHVPRLFERFYRVDKGRSRATGGTGLGLSIVRHIVEAHGGSVTVDSELNKGSTFTVVFPNKRSASKP